MKHYPIGAGFANCEFRIRDKTSVQARWNEKGKSLEFYLKYLTELLLPIGED